MEFPKIILWVGLDTFWNRDTSTIQNFIDDIM